MTMLYPIPHYNKACFKRTVMYGLMITKSLCHLVSIIQPSHEISKIVVCATNKGSDQPAYLISAFASRLNIL